MDSEIVYDLQRLKRCPFCGSTVAIKIITDEKVKFGYHSVIVSPVHYFKPWCFKCGCTIDAVPDYGDMVERWNRREGMV